MNDIPLISVLLPMYNESVEYASASIDSILQQSYKNIEVILLLDNPHNLHLIELCERYLENDQRCVLKINRTNLGLPQTLNRGIEIANGEYIARMDADDISCNTRFQQQLEYLTNHPEIDLIGSNAYIINEKNLIIGYYNKLKTDRCIKTFLKNVSSNMIHPSWFGRTKMFKQLKYRDFNYCEDYDFLLRAMWSGYNFANLNQPLLKYRIVQNNNISISRLKAYEQYINTITARRLYREAQRKDIYPKIPLIKKKENRHANFQKCNSLINRLRQAVNNHSYLLATGLIVRIIAIDHRPITSRLNSFYWFKILSFLEKVKNMF